MPKDLGYGANAVLLRGLTGQGRAILRLELIALGSGFHLQTILGGRCTSDLNPQHANLCRNEDYFVLKKRTKVKNYSTKKIKNVLRIQVWTLYFADLFTRMSDFNHSSDEPKHVEHTRRREYRNLHVLHDLPTYRLPLPGWISILHRASGVLMLLALGPLLWHTDILLTAGQSSPQIWQLPIELKLLLIALSWAFVHHLLAGIWHLWFDINNDASDKRSRPLVATFIIAFPVIISSFTAAHLFFYR